MPFCVDGTSCCSLFFCFPPWKVKSRKKLKPKHESQGFLSTICSAVWEKNVDTESAASEFQGNGTIVGEWGTGGGMRELGENSLSLTTAALACSTSVTEV